MAKKPENGEEAEEGRSRQLTHRCLRSIGIWGDRTRRKTTKIKKDSSYFNVSGIGFIVLAFIESPISPIGKFVLIISCSSAIASNVIVSGQVILSPQL